MDPKVSEEDLLIEDIKPELMQRIEESARRHGRDLEEEVKFLIARGLMLPSDR
jgi:hypothetical protein